MRIETCIAALALAAAAAAAGNIRVGAAPPDGMPLVADADAWTNAPPRRVEVYRLELVDGAPLIVGADGVRRRAVVVEPGEYAAVTSRLDRLEREIYAVRHSRGGMSARQIEWRRLRDEALSAPPREVAVEHDAATGRDKVAE